MNTILIVDDTNTNLLVLRRMLESSYNVISSEGGLEVIELAKKHNPILIVLDIMMPTYTGYDLARLLKNNPETSSIPFIFLTALNDETSESEGFNIGGIDFISKPIRLTIKNRIDAHVATITHLRELEQKAQLDPLTRIYNKGYFNEKIDQEWKRAHRTNRPISMIMADIDYFKELNSSVGHLQADFVLQRFANILIHEARRSSDVVARIGGDEFAILLPETLLVNAIKIADRLWNNVKKEGLPHPGSPYGIVTCSVGVASDNAQRGEFSRLIEQADKNMYKAKMQGKNQIYS